MRVFVPITLHPVSGHDSAGRDKRISKDRHVILKNPVFRAVGLDIFPSFQVLEVPPSLELNVDLGYRSEIQMRALTISNASINRDMPSRYGYHTQKIFVWCNSTKAETSSGPYAFLDFSFCSPYQCVGPCQMTNRLLASISYDPEKY